MSHPTWVRGLKWGRNALKTALKWSHPTWVRGLKLILITFLFFSDSGSHPTWVRGLK